MLLPTIIQICKLVGYYYIVRYIRKPITKLNASLYMNIFIAEQLETRLVLLIGPRINLYPPVAGVSLN